MTGASGRGKQLAAAIGVTVQGPMQSLAGIARRLERAGVDSVWTGDYFQSGLVRAGVLGVATSGALVGTHVLQAFARSPLATALAAQDLQELTDGRFVLGLGSQFPVANRRWHGVTVERPVAALREYVAAVRALLAAPGDESVRFDGEQFRYRVPPFRGTTARPAPPVWIGGAGPATVRLAADVAEGWPDTCCGRIPMSGTRFARSSRRARFRSPCRGWSAAGRSGARTTTCCERWRTTS